MKMQEKHIHKHSFKISGRKLREQQRCIEKYGGFRFARKKRQCKKNKKKYGLMWKLLKDRNKGLKEMIKHIQQELYGA